MADVCITSFTCSVSMLVSVITDVCNTCSLFMLKGAFIQQISVIADVCITCSLSPLDNVLLTEMQGQI